ncbi:MAG: substrate-binding domain-containing protein [Candidatus Freyarchaeota archaeon]|nr:substrate-binding domain-containing protein [Candidatus Jordarchaeia archaeon]MBS7269925.1 substrate-binding domain-containing protein [Candidatus Jordarchaeia archaeon]MBS7280152.1 substrate-binding domain-containing protein [Candidatus Jordarchaeia archaeon]
MSQKQVLNIYSCCDVATPLKISGKSFQEICGVELKYTIGLSSEIIPKIEAGLCDVFACGAAYIMDELQKNNLIDGETRSVLGCRRSVILTQKGNPKRIKSLRDLTRKDIKIAVSTVDSLKGVWDEIASKTALTQEIQKNIILFADGCGELLGSIVKKKVDAAFGWNTYKVLHPKTFHAIEIPKEAQVYRSTLIATTTFCKNRDAAKKFIQFLTSKEGIKKYKNYGWLTK